MLDHGGRLRTAAQQHKIPLADWLDLSTGINPRPYPVTAPAPAAWHRLPEEDDGLETAAQAYYGNAQLLPVAGSQAAIQLLPKLFPPAAIALSTPVYAEHPQAWTLAGHRVRQLPGANLTRLLTAATPMVLLCNPNNPTATAYSRTDILAAAASLGQRGGWLIVDEAFADATPETSVADQAGSAEYPRLVVLRSLGKFFGLAGARVGFLFGPADLLARMRESLGPWTVAGPSRAAAIQALGDTAWQAATRAELAAAGQRLAELLAPLGEVKGTALFATLTAADPLRAKALYNFLAGRGILIRRFDQSPLLRFGLPGSDHDWERLTAARDQWLQLRAE